MTARISWLMIAWVCAGIACAQEDPTPTGSDAGATSYAEAFADRDYEAARDALERELRLTPLDPVLTYNLACAQAQLGQTEEATETLIDAISRGMVDFHHLARDPHLEPIRDHRSYRLILRGWRDLLDARGDAEFEAAREALGPTYTYDTDPAMRLHFASAAEERAYESAREEVGRTTEWALRHVFPDGWDEASDERPDPWVLVLIPSPEDFFRIVRAAGIGGYYDKDRKRLVTQDVGPSLRHEFFHVLHWRHMDRLGQVHPYWVMEGLACLLEDVSVTDDGRYELEPSWRTNISKRLERAGRLRPLKQLFSMERPYFMGSKSRANYAQARAFCLFLFDEGVLREWYATYVELYHDEPTGSSATETVFGLPLEDVERRYKAWLRELPEVAEIIRPADVSLGVELSAGRGDGPAVAALPSRRARFPGDERLRLRDVVNSIDGQPVRTLDDLHRILTDHEVGDRIIVGVRRGQRQLEVLVELISRADADRSSGWP